MLVGVYSADEFSKDALLAVEIFDLQEGRFVSTNRKVSDFNVDFIDATEWFGEVDCEPDTEGELEKLDDACGGHVGYSRPMVLEVTLASRAKSAASEGMSAAKVTDQSGLVVGSPSRSIEATLAAMMRIPPVPKSEVL